MKIGVVTFPGSNCNMDIVHALRINLKYEVVELWHKDSDLQDVEAVVLPGGFSYGDYLRSGAIARFSPIMEEVIKYAHDGGKVLGICNGFQILCESGLLPGALIRNKNLKFKCSDVYLKTNHMTKFSNKIKKDAIIKIPISHGEGNYQASRKDLNDIKNNDQILFTYCSMDGDEDAKNNPNGSALNIAGITNTCLLYTSPSPRDQRGSGMPASG